MARFATPSEKMVCNLALKVGLRDQEVQFSEYTDISWHESVYRVRSKPQVWLQRQRPRATGYERRQLSALAGAGPAPDAGQDLLLPYSRASSPAMTGTKDQKAAGRTARGRQTLSFGAVGMNHD